MSEPVTNELIYSVLQKLPSEVAESRYDVTELKSRSTATDEHLGNMILSLSGVDRRLDRVEERLGRVERRLELREAE